MKLKALILSQDMELISGVLPIITEAGFEVHVLTDNPFFRKSKFIRQYEEVASRDHIIQEMFKKNVDCYDFIIVGNDGMMKGILDSDLPLEKKIKILPVTGGGGIFGAYLF